MRPAPFAFARPDGLADALSRLGGDDDAMPIAGGQSLLVLLGLRLAGAETLVDVTRIPELCGAREADGAVVFGAATTHAMIEDGKVPDPSRGLMRRVAGRIAYRAVRNRGTIGGSLALSDPAADWCPVLIALGATYDIVSAGGARQVAAEDFADGAYSTVLEPGELIRSITVPVVPEGTRWGHAKHARKTGAFAESIAVVVKRPDGVRAALGATGSHAVLLPAVAEAVASGGDIAAAARADIAMADPDADAYRARCHLATILNAAREVCA